MNKRVKQGTFFMRRRLVRLSFELLEGWARSGPAFEELLIRSKTLMRTGSSYVSSFVVSNLFVHPSIIDHRKAVSEIERSLCRRSTHLELSRISILSSMITISPVKSLVQLVCLASKLSKLSKFSTLLICRESLSWSLLS